MLRTTRQRVMEKPPVSVGTLPAAEPLAKLLYNFRCIKSIIDRFAAPIEVSGCIRDQGFKFHVVIKQTLAVQRFGNQFRVAQVVADDWPQSDLNGLSDAQSEMLLSGIGDNNITLAECLKIWLSVQKSMVDHTMLQLVEDLRWMLMTWTKKMDVEVQAFIR